MSMLSLVILSVSVFEISCRKTAKKTHLRRWKQLSRLGNNNTDAKVHGDVVMTQPLRHFTL